MNKKPRLNYVYEYKKREPVKTLGPREIKTIMAEMARRKKQYYQREPVETLRAWMVIRKDEARCLENQGLVKIAGMTGYGNKPHVWVYPTERALEEYIDPMVKSYTVSQLIKMAGWDE